MADFDPFADWGDPPPPPPQPRHQQQQEGRLAAEGRAGAAATFDPFADDNDAPAPAGAPLTANGTADTDDDFDDFAEPSVAAPANDDTAAAVAPSGPRHAVDGGDEFDDFTHPTTNRSVQLPPRPPTPTPTPTPRAVPDDEDDFGSFGGPTTVAPPMAAAGQDGPPRDPAVPETDHGDFDDFAHAAAVAVPAPQDVAVATATESGMTPGDHTVPMDASEHVQNQRAETASSSCPSTPLANRISYAVAAAGVAAAADASNSDMLNDDSFGSFDGDAADVSLNGMGVLPGGRGDGTDGSMLVMPRVYSGEPPAAAGTPGGMSAVVPLSSPPYDGDASPDMAAFLGGSETPADMIPHAAIGLVGAAGPGQQQAMVVEAVAGGDADDGGDSEALPTPAPEGDDAASPVVGVGAPSVSPGMDEPRSDDDVEGAFGSFNAPATADNMNGTMTWGDYGGDDAAPAEPTAPTPRPSELAATAAAGVVDMSSDALEGGDGGDECGDGHRSSVQPHDLPATRDADDDFDDDDFGEPAFAVAAPERAPAPAAATDHEVDAASSAASPPLDHAPVGAPVTMRVSDPVCGTHGGDTDDEFDDFKETSATVPPQHPGAFTTASPPITASAAAAAAADDDEDDFDNFAEPAETAPRPHAGAATWADASVFGHLPATAPSVDATSGGSAAGDEAALDSLMALAASGVTDDALQDDPPAAVRALLDAELGSLQREAAAAAGQRLPPSIGHHLAAFAASGATTQSPASPGALGGGMASLAAFSDAEVAAVVADDAEAELGPYHVTSLPAVRLCDLLLARDVPVLGLLGDSHDQDAADDAGII